MRKDLERERVGLEREEGEVVLGVGSDSSADHSTQEVEAIPRPYRDLNIPKRVACVNCRQRLIT